MATRSRRQKVAAVRYADSNSSSEEDPEAKENNDEESDSDIEGIESSSESESESESESSSDSQDYDSKRKGTKKAATIQQEVSQEQASSDQKHAEVAETEVTELSSCPMEGPADGDDLSKEKVTPDSETTNRIQEESNDPTEDGEILVAQRVSDTTAVWDTFLFTITAVVADRTTMPCPVCSKELEKSDKLMKHINFHHKNVKDPFKCEQCEEKFPNWVSLKRHVKWNHKEKETFQCQRCNKVYTTQHLLNSHCQKLHADIKPVRPPRNRTQKGTERPKPAAHYEKERKRDRLRRMNPLTLYLAQFSDPPFKCPDCPLDNFLTKPSLQRHYAQAHKSRPFICELCGKGYINSGQLKEHMSTVHTDDRPFVCDQCGVRCKRKTHLDMHINTVHSYEGKKAIQEQYRVRRELKKQREQKLAYLSQEL